MQARENLANLYVKKGFEIALGNQDCNLKMKHKGYCLFIPNELKPEILTTKFNFYKDFKFSSVMAQNECKKIGEDYSGFARVSWITPIRKWSKF